ncbi:hypothetical protein ES703_55275 [subsurface metagenome]
MLNNSHCNVFVFLKTAAESIYISDTSKVINNEEQVWIFGLIGEDVVIYLSDYFLFPLVSTA